MNKEDAISKRRWDFLYNKTISQTRDLEKYYKWWDKKGKQEFQYIRHNINKKKGNFLEIGCGMAGVGLQVKGCDWNVYGVDFSSDNLEGAKKYWTSRHKFCHFVHGDISNLPFKNNMFDLVYGGGVLEHVYKTESVVNEIFRVLKPGGIVINTVPAFSLASLTYRQLSGTIPEIPILKSVFEFIHIKLLKRKFMHTGYEKCFSKNYLIQIYKRAGFGSVKVKHDEKFEPVFPTFPKFIKAILNKVEKLKPFWAWYIIEAKKLY
jgi:ubiquinone/menaquinone biosynthesis C-methylase UbiE